FAALRVSSRKHHDERYSSISTETPIALLPMATTPRLVPWAMSAARSAVDGSGRRGGASLRGMKARVKPHQRSTVIKSSSMRQSRLFQSSWRAFLFLQKQWLFCIINRYQNYPYNAHSAPLWNLLIVF